MAPSNNHHHEHDTARKRVPKACDRCRLKKVKCDGNMPCPRCKQEDAVCHYGARRKSIDRPVSAGYVEQIETQQKILIRALRETWKRYAPPESQGQNGREPSIHSIVKALGVLQAIDGHQPLPKDFHFNEDIFDTASQTSQTSFDNDFAPYEAKPILTRLSSPETYIDRVPSMCGNTEPMSSSSSRAQSEGASTHATTLSPVSSGLPDIKEDSMLTKAIPLKPLRPKHCPMPPRINTMPVKPVPLDTPMHNTPEELSYDMRFMPVEQQPWQIDNDMTFNHSLMMTPGQIMMNYGNIAAPQVSADSWDSWIDLNPNQQQMMFQS